MQRWGKRKDGQSYPKDGKKGVKGSNTSPVSDIHLKEKEKEQRTKEIKIWKIDEAPEDLKKKILEKHRDINVDSDTLTWGDWLLDSEIFYWNEDKIYYDLYRGQYIQFEDLRVKDSEKFRKLLRVPKELWKKLDFKFENISGNLANYNTKIKFTEETSKSYDELDENGNGGDLSDTEKAWVSQAYEKFDEIIQESYVALKNNYEYQLSDEAVEETLIANEYDFDENGDIV